MSTDEKKAAENASQNSGDTLMVGFECAAVVQEDSGRKRLEFPIPQSMQGHTFCIDATRDSSPGDTEPLPEHGPWVVEFILGSEFVIYQNELSGVDPEAGHSHFRLSDTRGLRIHYSPKEAPGLLKTANLEFLTNPAGVLQRLRVEIDEDNLDLAARRSLFIVSDLLDSLSYQKRAPLQIRHVCVSAKKSPKTFRWYRTIPYTTRELRPAELARAAAEPQALRPCLRLFREAINSARPHYRLLCLYRIREHLDRVRAANDHRILQMGRTPKRPTRRVPDNELTQKYFAEFIGKKISALLDQIRREYRVPVAHVNLTDFERLVLDPADVRCDHRLDYTNTLLIGLLTDLIEDERHLMETEGLAGGEAA